MLKGADIVLQCLRAEGVDLVFGYPGGAIMPLYDALEGSGIRHVLTRHEQGAAFAAEGYARVTGKVGVAIATSGPGATNLVTGIADANSDSIPILCITGNVATRWLGRNAFQEVDIVAITTPITKLSRQVRRVEETASAVQAAAAFAVSGRPGPVLLDFPKDVQQQILHDPACRVPVASETTEHRRPALTSVEAHPYMQLAQLLAGSQRPVIYAGGGVIAAEQRAALTDLAEALGCPVALTLMGLGAMDQEHPLCLGPLGMHGAWCANVAVNEADLVLALGVRFDDRVIGDPDLFASTATIVHVDIDARELGKTSPFTWAFAPICAMHSPSCCAWRTICRPRLGSPTLRQQRATSHCWQRTATA